MGSRELNYGFAHGALAVISGWSCVQCSDLKYARLAFGLYAANGFVGVINFLLPRRNNIVTRVLDIIARFSRPFYLPLIAAEAILFAGFDEKYSYCFLVYPTVHLVLTELLKKNMDSSYLDASNIISSIAVAYSAYEKQDIWGGVCAVLGFIFTNTPFNSLEYLLLISATNMAAVQFFKQVF